MSRELLAVDEMGKEALESLVGIQKIALAEQSKYIEDLIQMYENEDLNCQRAEQENARLRVILVEQYNHRL